MQQLIMEWILFARQKHISIVYVPRNFAAYLRKILRNYRFEMPAKMPTNRFSQNSSLLSVFVSVCVGSVKMPRRWPIIHALIRNRPQRFSALKLVFNSVWLYAPTQMLICKIFQNKICRATIATSLIIANNNVSQQ